MLCHASWSPWFDILLPPSAAVFTAPAEPAASDEAEGAVEHSAPYQLAVAIRRRHVFLEAHVLRRCQSFSCCLIFIPAKV
jgi:hypothetical protein